MIIDPSFSHLMHTRTHTHTGTSGAPDFSLGAMLWRAGEWLCNFTILLRPFVPL